MKSMTYGTLPLETEFVAAFETFCPDGRFKFGNDERVGNDTLNCTELWNELVKAHGEWNDFSDDTEYGEDADSAGDWCSAVLSVLGFEWI